VDIEEGPIWAVLREKAPDRAPLIRSLAQEAAGKLRLVRDTFPTYTLHDEVHAANVLRLMGQLLGERVEELRGLEAAMLILAAYYHDIGMVYTAAELAGVRDEPEFAAYLSTHHEDYLAVRAAGGEPPLEVLERYCRSRHADRVYDHLAALSDRLVWGNAPLFKALGELCRSHNLDVGQLKSDEFDPDFLAQCDLRFCAVLLRLADILDLDSTRTPRSIYDHLGLAGRRTAQAAVSDGEWRKHLCADGFVFPSSRPPNYPLPFIAGPDHPAVEHDIRDFLDAVDDELRRCRPVLDACAQRWRDLALPGEADRRGIIGRGYTYGAFRFELDRRGVLELFTGERLYNDPHVFVRELLQNAIDAVRLRQALGLAHDSVGVAVTAWEDSDGFLWLRVDDDGVGMDERTVREYFLRVGRSYYNSPELRADLARGGRPDSDFGAISRFGIGVLSCFIAGDLVELSTLRVLPGGACGQPLRLSLGRDDEYFVMREPPDPPGRMPKMGPTGETTYRRTPGTSIAVRIDPMKVEVTADALARRVDECLSGPPVPVTFKGRPAGQPPRDELARPAVQGPVLRTIVAPPLHFIGPLEVGILPLDLTAASATRMLRGQLLLLGARVPTLPGGQPSTDLLAGWPEEELASIPPHVRAMCAAAVHRYEVGVSKGDGLVVTVDRYVRYEVAWRLRDELGRLPQVPPALASYMAGLAPGRVELEEPSIRSEVVVPPADLPPRLRDGWDIRWAHNGIAIPKPIGNRRARGRGLSSLAILGDIALYDRLRPDLTVSRGKTQAMTMGVRSALELALRRSMRVHTAGQLAWLAEASSDHVHRRVVGRESSASPRLGELLADPLVASGEWAREPLFPDGDGRLASAEEIRSRFPPRVDAELELESHDGTLVDHLRDCVAQVGLDLVCSTDGEWTVRSGAVPELPAGLRWFGPLRFVPVDAPITFLCGEHTPFNRDNPLARWLIANAEALANDLPVLFARFVLVLESTRSMSVIVNLLLSQVAARRPDLAAPPEAYLRDDSPEGEWWTR